MDERDRTDFGAPDARAADARADELRVPVVREELVVGTRERVTGRVRVTSTPRVEERVVSAPVARSLVDLERVAVDREVSDWPAEWMEGDVRVIPVVEERLVVEKRLFVVEEIRVRRRRAVEDRDVTVELRRTDVTVERE